MRGWIRGELPYTLKQRSYVAQSFPHHFILLFNSIKIEVYDFELCLFLCCFAAALGAPALLLLFAVVLLAPVGRRYGILGLGDVERQSSSSSRATAVVKHSSQHSHQQQKASQAARSLDAPLAFLGACSLLLLLPLRC